MNSLHRLRRLIVSTTLLSLGAIALAGCDDATAPAADPAAEALAAQIREMPSIDLIHVFHGDAGVTYIFTTGTRADAIRMSDAQVDDTLLAVRTIDQGMYYFALDEVRSASIDGSSLVLRF